MHSHCCATITTIQIGTLVWLISIYPHPRTCLLVFRERGRKGEIAGEKDRGWLPFVHVPTREWTHTPGICPDRGLNLQSSLWDDAPPAEPHQSGQVWFKISAPRSHPSHTKYKSPRLQPGHLLWKDPQKMRKYPICYTHFHCWMISNIV